MMFPNKLPLTAPAVQWIEDGLPPDEWLWHYPAGLFLIETKARPVPEASLYGSFYPRYLYFINWLMLESMWCQLYRLHQVSHQEWQLVLDYCLELEREAGYLVPNHFTGVGFDLSLNYCEFDGDYARYAEWMRLLFSKYRFIRNPTKPLDDQRHPRYNEWASIRNYRRPKDIVKVSTGNCDQINSLVIEEE